MIVSLVFLYGFVVTHSLSQASRQVNIFKRLYTLADCFPCVLWLCSTIYWVKHKILSSKMQTANSLMYQLIVFPVWNLAF